MRLTQQSLDETKKEEKMNGMTIFYSKQSTTTQGTFDVQPLILGNLIKQ